MIHSLRGKLIHKDAEGCVIECGGVGYGLLMSTASLEGLGSGEVFVLVHTHLTQDALRLYGFATAEERACFLTLIGTSGVGPKLALSILSSLLPSELFEVVARGDRATLQRVPGVGGKKAERLLVELKGKLPEAPAAVRLGLGAVRADLVSALENLGFAAPTAERAAREALEEHPGVEELPTLVRAALRKTTR